VKIRILMPCLALLLGSAAALPSAAQQLAPPKKDGQIPAPPASARIWKSQTTGREYRVWIENERLFAEWVNVPPQAAQQGASIRIECRRTGSRWVGMAQNHLPCDTTESGKRVTNFCRVTSKIEFDALEANRMTGRAEWARRFDCANCKVLEFAWHNFEWVPKEPSPVPMKQ